MKRYRIGEISKLLDMSQATLRFYEDHGIITPQKDEESNYRYYNAWDVTILIDSLFLRKMDFTLEQTEQMIHSMDLKEKTSLYIKQENLINQRIEQYRMMVDTLSRRRIKMQLYRNNAGKMTITKNPPLIYHRYMKNNHFESLTSSTTTEEMQKNMEEWIAMIPEITPTFLIQYDSYIEADVNKSQYWWGFSIPLEKAYQKGISPESPNEYLPPLTSIYTIFEANTSESLAVSLEEQVLRKVREEGHILNGNPMGRLIARAHEDGVHKVYLETWIPIAE